MYRMPVITLLLLALSCGKAPKPKPSGELRLEYPAAQYQPFQACAYGFDYSTQARVSAGKQPCWYYITYPTMKAKIFITYFPVKNDFPLHVKEAEKLVYEHTIKASSIDTKTFQYPGRHVYGNFYELKGETASNIQFYITDSTKHFVTANLYFNTRPQPDSLAPAVDYIKKDMLRMIDTFHWTN